MNGIRRYSIGLPVVLALAACGPGQDDKAPAPPPGAVAAVGDRFITASDLTDAADPLPWLPPATDVQERAANLALAWTLDALPSNSADQASERVLSALLAAETLCRERLARDVRDATPGWVERERATRSEEFAGELNWWIQFVHLPVESDDSERAALEEAARMLAEIAEGADFTDLADRRSRSAAGSLPVGPLTREDLHPRLVEALLGMEPGEIAGPITTPSSVKILHLRRTFQSPPLSDEAINARLRAEFAGIESRRVLTDLHWEWIHTDAPGLDGDILAALHALRREAALPPDLAAVLPDFVLEDEHVWPTLMAATAGATGSAGSGAASPVLTAHRRAQRLVRGLADREGRVADGFAWPEAVLAEWRARDPAGFDDAVRRYRSGVLAEKGFRFFGASLAPPPVAGAAARSGA